MFMATISIPAPPDPNTPFTTAFETLSSLPSAASLLMLI
jgi:hypothetical protein